MPLIPDHSRQPPGGHSFPDAPGVILRADSIPALLESIADYRAKNGMPPGNPERELESYYKDRYPWLISRVGVTPATPEDPILRWLNRQWRTPVEKWAEAEVARSRYGRCLACPHYASDYRFNQESKRRLMVIGAGRLGGMDGVCRAHHWSCALACAAEKLQSPVDVPECWVRD